MLVETAAIALAIVALQRMGTWLRNDVYSIRMVITLTGVTLWMLAALFMAVSIWSVAFYLLGIFNTVEQALYFSMVSFTTLGYGDVTLEQDWRLLSGCIAANGLILFSLSTAFLFEVLGRLHQGRLSQKSRD